MRVQMLFRLSLGALLSQLRRARPSGAIKTSGAPSAAGGQKEWRSTRSRQSAFALVIEVADGDCRRRSLGRSTLLRHAVDAVTPVVGRGWGKPLRVAPTTGAADVPQPALQRQR